MRKIKSIGAILAMLAGVLVLAAPTAANAANAANAESVYTTNSIQRCLFGTNLCMTLQAFATYSSTQIWINGHVSCSQAGNAATITWCGVGGGNGTATLNIGVNWNWPSLRANGLYERMNIKANHGGCATWGSNANIDGNSWFNGELTCESPA